MVIALPSSNHLPTLMTDLVSRALAPSTGPQEARQAALACMVTLAVALGVGRFAFTPLLPLMLHGGSLDIRQGGWLASWNYLGYFVGAVACAAFRVDPARMVRAGLAVTVALTLGMGFTHSFWLWATIRFVGGAVSAWTFVFASQWGLRKLAALGANQWGGVIYTGPGLGIVGTGLLVSAAGGFGATAGWIGFGLISAVLTVLVWGAFKANRLDQAKVAATPRDASGHPGPHAGASGQLRADSTRRVPAAPPVRPEEPANSTRPAAGVPHRSHIHRADAFWLVVLYGVPGFGYIITATFLPVIARAALPGSSWPDLFWPMFGAALMVGALLGARLPLHWDNRTLLAGCYVLQAAGIALGIIWPTAGGFAIGSMLIGLPFTAITLFAMREARRLHGEQAAGLMGYATAAYGVGQIVGPLVAAPIAAHTGSFSPALWLAVGALMLGALGLVVVTYVRRARTGQ
jgi:MFS family permease